MTVPSDDPKLQAVLVILLNSIDERLARCEVELTKKLDDRLARIDAVLAALAADAAYRKKTQATAERRRRAAAERETAAIAAQNARPFDPNNIYKTLINPRGRMKDVLIAYAAEVTKKYSELPTRKAVLESFTTDFRHWDETHFRSLPKTYTAKLREVLLEKQVSVRGGRFPAFRALSRIIRNSNNNRAAVVTVATAAAKMEVKSVDIAVNGANKVNAASSHISPPTKPHRT